MAVTGRMPRRIDLPSVETLRKCFDYNEATGELIWRRRDDRLANWNATWPGTTAGSLRRDGYLCVAIARVQYATHRIVWKMLRGYDPAAEIDHIDGDKLNNRIENLREASAGENHRNSCARGEWAKGVYRNRHGAFVAQIKVDGVNTYLGTFNSETEAHAAYAGAAKVLFKDFACLDR